MKKIRFLVPLITGALMLIIPGCARGGKSMTLMTATIRGDIEAIKKIDQNGANLNEPDPGHFNWTPLMASVYFDHTNITHYLLNRGADIRKRDDRGNTAFMWAINVDNREAAKLMIQMRPHELRNSEDWQTIQSAIEVSPSKTTWHTLTEDFLRTNTANRP